MHGQGLGISNNWTANAHTSKTATNKAKQSQENIWNMRVLFQALSLKGIFQTRLSRVNVSFRGHGLDWTRCNRSRFPRPCCRRVQPAVEWLTGQHIKKSRRKAAFSRLVLSLSALDTETAAGISLCLEAVLVQAHSSSQLFPLVSPPCVPWRRRTRAKSRDLRLGSADSHRHGQASPAAASLERRLSSVEVKRLSTIRLA